MPLHSVALMLPEAGTAHLDDRRPAVEHSQRHHAGRVVGVPVLLHLHLAGWNVVSAIGRLSCPMRQQT